MDQDLTNWLIGSWISDPSVDASEKTRLDFSIDGCLIYTIVEEDNDQVFLLTYRIENNALITDQPSHPREERSDISIGTDGKLSVTYEEMTTVFVRCHEPNPRSLFKNQKSNC